MLNPNKISRLSILPRRLSEVRCQFEAATAEVAEPPPSAPLWRPASWLTVTSVCCCVIQSAPVRVSPAAHLAHWQGLFTGGGAGWEEEGEHTRTHSNSSSSSTRTHTRRDLQSVYNLPLCECVDWRSSAGTWPLICYPPHHHPGDKPAVLIWTTWSNSGSSSSLPLSSKHTPGEGVVFCVRACKALASPSVEAIRTNLCNTPAEEESWHWSYGYFFHPVQVPVWLLHMRCSPAAMLSARWTTWVIFFFRKGKTRTQRMPLAPSQQQTALKQNSQQPKLHVAVAFL